MAEIGTSYISFADSIIFGVAIALFYFLVTLPANSLAARIIAVACGCAIGTTVVVIIVANDLTYAGVSTLATVGIGLALGLFHWNDARVKSNASSVTAGKIR